jgi:K+-sensing histidine kinase KdpD
MKTRFARYIGPAAALALCTVAAWLVTLVKWNPPAQEFIPFAFLGVVLALGWVFGRMVGIIGSVVSALVFAHLMYAPVGSFQIADQGARSGVAWMLLAGVSLSYLLLPADRDHPDRSKRSP